MKRTNFERDTFNEAFHKVFDPAEVLLLEVACQEHKHIGDFYLYYDEDEFYFINLDTGMIVQYYKHLGRCNAVNDDISIDELVDFLTDLKEAICDENI